jgi:ribosomal protein S3
MSDTEKQIAADIGEFYLQKNNADYEATRKEIKDIGFDNIAVISPNKIKITVRRPGLFIGKRNKNIVKLETYLRRRIVVKETRECVEDYIIPQPPTEFNSDEEKQFVML